jgi:hypothetical protein
MVKLPVCVLEKWAKMAVLGTGLLAALSSCGPSFVKYTYYPKPMLTGPDTYVDSIRLKKYLSSLLGYRCDELTIGLDKITCTQNYKECISWETKYETECQEVKHPGKCYAHADCTDPYTTTECSPTKREVCTQDQPATKVSWEIVKEDCLSVYADMTERTTGEKYFGSSVYVAPVNSASEPIFIGGGYDALRARILADLLFTYCAVSRVE